MTLANAIVGWRGAAVLCTSPSACTLELARELVDELPYDAILTAIRRGGKFYLPQDGSDLVLNAGLNLARLVEIHNLTRHDPVSIAAEFLILAQTGVAPNQEISYTSYIAEGLIIRPARASDNFGKAVERLVQLTEVLVEMATTEMMTAKGRPPSPRSGNIEVARHERRSDMLLKLAVKAIETARAFGGAHAMLAPLQELVDLAADGDAEESRRLLVHRPNWKLHDLSMMPQTAHHEELNFIRVLHGHELIWNAMISFLVETRDLLQADKYEDAAAAMARVNELNALVPSVFRLVATMTHDSFLEFRDATQGSSALQSTQFKTIEALCAPLPPQRLQGEAYRRHAYALAEASGPTLWDAFELAARKTGLDISAAGLTGEGALLRMAGQMRAFDLTCAAWRRAHLGLATKMLSDLPGSGGTSGISYLERWVARMYFPKLHRVAAPSVTQEEGAHA